MHMKNTTHAIDSILACIGIKQMNLLQRKQGWGPRGLSSSSRTARGPKIVALALASASNSSGLGLGL